LKTNDDIKYISVNRGVNTNKNQISTLIFDFDGTLADTMPNSSNAFQTVFETYDDKQYSDDEINDMFGPIKSEIIKEYLVSDDVDDAIELHFKTWTDKHERLVIENHEVSNMLEHSKNKSYKFAIVTGKFQRSMDISLEFQQMENIFDYTVTSDDLNKFKPDPEGKSPLD